MKICLTKKMFNILRKWLHRVHKLYFFFFLVVVNRTFHPTSFFCMNLIKAAHLDMKKCLKKKRGCVGRRVSASNYSHDHSSRSSQKLSCHVSFFNSLGSVNYFILFFCIHHCPFQHCQEGERENFTWLNKMSK